MGLIPRQTLNVRRPTGGARVNGKWVPSGSSTDFTIQASVQPLKAKEMQMLPESRRSAGESYKLFSNTSSDLKTVKTDENPDIVEIYGQDFEVFSRENWSNNIINHHMYIVIRVTAK